MIFSPRATAVILKILHPFKYPGLRVTSSEKIKISFTTVRRAYSAEMAMGASSIAQNRTSAKREAHLILRALERSKRKLGDGLLGARNSSQSHGYPITDIQLQKDQIGYL